MSALSADQVEKIEALRRTIEAIRGVISCHIIPNAEGEPAEISILAHTFRSAKQIIQDVVTVCAVQYDLMVDAQRIALTQIDDETESALTRLQIACVQWTTEPRETRVRVELAGGEQRYTGEASGLTSMINRNKLVAMATALAVEKYLACQCRLTVDDVVKFNIGRYSGVLVGMTVVTPDGEETLIGSSLIKKDGEDEAIIKAVLGAINREILRKYAPVEQIDEEETEEGVSKERAEVIPLFQGKRE